MPHTLRIVVVGDSFSGKTKLIKRMVHPSSQYSDRYETTIGSDFDQLPLKYDVLPYIYDTAGQERFKNLSVGVYKDAHLFLYCLDFSLKMTKERQKSIEQELQKCINSAPGSKVLIVATKSDKLEPTSMPNTIELLGESRVVIVTSAKKNEGITELEAFLYGFAKTLFPFSTKYREIYDKLTATLNNLPQAISNDIGQQLTDLEKLLANHSIDSQVKISMLDAFRTRCESLLKENHFSALKLIGELIAIIAIPLLVGLVGFGIGFALGLWTGPGAFLAGIIAGQAAAVTVAAVTGASTLGSAGLGCYFFKPMPGSAPNIVSEFAVAAQKEFHLSAPAA